MQWTTRTHCTAPHNSPACMPVSPPATQTLGRHGPRWQRWRRHQAGGSLARPLAVPQPRARAGAAGQGGHATERIDIEQADPRLVSSSGGGSRSGRGSSSSGADAAPPSRMEGRFSYKMVKAQPVSPTARHADLCAGTRGCGWLAVSLVMARAATADCLRRRRRRWRCWSTSCAADDCRRGEGKTR